MSEIHEKPCSVEDFLLQIFIELHGIPKDIQYDPYRKVWIVEYIKIE